ncbi:LuxR C-terminal-related transcriptional regulator [Microvirga sp. GCM10011540]|uniref:LuxR C-terminal-related transcriptional regulator n=1 Tax=Microvirga sp. GCM10011540 TaxID=3317338 RepID=UPI00361FE785
MTAEKIDFAATRLPQAEASDQASRSVVLTVLACDNPLLRTGLRQILAGTTFGVAEGHQGPSLILPKEHKRPVLVIFEAAQNVTKTWFEAVLLAKQSFPEARVVALTDQADPSLVRLGLEAGVDGVCLNGADREILIKSLELVMLGETVLPSETMRTLLGRMAKGLVLEPQDGTRAEAKPLDLRTHKLSAREAEVLKCLMGGDPNKIIARKLDVAEATVKVHVKAVLRKIGAANRTQAAMWATEHLSPSSRAFVNA